MHEEPLKQLHPRAVWLFFFPALGFPIFGALMLIFLSLDPNAGDDDAWAIMSTFLVVATLGLTLVAYIWARLTHHYYKYQLRPDAFRKEHGIVWKKYVSIPYERIQNVDIRRGLIARLLGLSDVQIQTAGMSSITGSYGASSEGRLPGLAKEEAEKIRDELIRRAKGQKPHDGI